MAVSYAPIRAAWLPGSPELTSWPTAWMYPRSRGVGDPVVGALSIEAFVSSMVRPCLSPPKGLPQLLSAMPQCAIAQSGSRGNQNECSSATPLLKSSFTTAAHEVWNFTLALPIASGGAAPCWSCCANAPGAHAITKAAIGRRVFGFIIIIALRHSACGPAASRLGTALEGLRKTRRNHLTLR